MIHSPDILIRVSLAVLLGGLVGLEREYTQKVAGLRTHILVTLGATLYTMVSMADITTTFDSIHNLPESVSVQINRDPSRVMAQIVSGIGFIGGGAVLRYGATIKGLTTAADLWAMASIGMLIGIGHYATAGIATCIIFLVLFTIGTLERNYFGKHLKGFNRLKINVSTEDTHALAIQMWIDERFDQNIIEAKTEVNHERQALDLSYTLSVGSRKIDVNDLSQRLSSLPGVKVSSVRAYHESEDTS